MTSAIRKRRRNINSNLNDDQILPLDILHYIFCQTRELIRKGMLLNHLLHNRLLNDYIKNICSEPITQKECLKYISIRKKRIKILCKTNPIYVMDTHMYFYSIGPKWWSSQMRDFTSVPIATYIRTKLQDTGNVYDIYFTMTNCKKLIDNLICFQNTKDRQFIDLEKLNLTYLDINTMLNILNRRRDCKKFIPDYAKNQCIKHFTEHCTRYKSGKVNDIILSFCYLRSVLNLFPDLDKYSLIEFSDLHYDFYIYVDDNDYPLPEFQDIINKIILYIETCYPFCIRKYFPQ